MPDDNIWIEVVFGKLFEYKYLHFFMLYTNVQISEFKVSMVTWNKYFLHTCNPPRENDCKVQFIKLNNYYFQKLFIL